MAALITIYIIGIPFGYLGIMTNYYMYMIKHGGEPNPDLFSHIFFLVFAFLSWFIFFISLIMFLVERPYNNKNKW